MNYLLFQSFNILESLICGRIAVAAVESLTAAQSASVFSLPQCCHNLHAIPHFFELRRCYEQNLDSYVTKYFRTIRKSLLLLCPLCHSPICVIFAGGRTPDSTRSLLHQQQPWQETPHHQVQICSLLGFTAQLGRDAKKHPTAGKLLAAETIKL